MENCTSKDHINIIFKCKVKWESVATKERFLLFGHLNCKGKPHVEVIMTV